MAIVDVIRKRVRTATLSRSAAAVITDGYAAPGAATTSEIDVHDQPLTPEEIRNLPPGQNATDWRNIWSETQLILRDRVTVGGKTYTVQRDEFWREGPFYHVQAVVTEDIL